MSTVLEISNLSKNYGSIQALKNVSFSVPKGTIFGILGPNGSGKTTMLGIIMDVLRATSGSISIFGHPPTAADRKRIGTLLETPNFYHYMTATDNLKITAEIKGVTNPDIDGVLQQVNLYQRRDSKFQTYSLGMKQRLAIATCLLGDPEVMVFDEPTNGLDPVGIAEIRELIKQLAKKGKTIIMASHLLDEVEKVCTHVAILKKGTLIVEGNVNEILVNDDIIEVGAPDLQQLKNVLQLVKGYTKLDSTDTGKMTINFPPGTADLGQLNAHCFQNGVVLNHLQAKKKSLETKFMELTNE
jgi:ABC-type multidrug transport system ATPase subunit